MHMSDRTGARSAGGGGEQAGVEAGGAGEVGDAEALVDAVEGGELGVVDRDNAVSIRLLERTGYVLATEEPTRFVYRRVRGTAP